MFLNQEKIDKEYGVSDNLWGNDQPNKYLVDLLKQLPVGARILDLGCGEGRNALYLAKQGYQVTAVDISATAIEKLNIASQELSLNMKIVCADMVQFNFDETWDLVFSTTVLHLLKKDEQAFIINKMKESVGVGGLNLITIFTKDDPGYQEFPELSFTDLEELKKMYEGWGIILEKNYTKNETHGVPHTHYIAVLAAVKPDVVGV